MRLFSLGTFVRARQWSDRVSGLLGLIKAFRTLKSIGHFLTANRKKTFQRIFSHNSGCKKSFERFSCLEFIFEKSKHREAGLKHKLINKLEDSGFLEKLKRLREWKLLSLCMFHRIIFLLFIVSSLSCNFNRCAVCFQTWTSLAGVLKMPRVSNAFEDYISL